MLTFPSEPHHVRPPPQTTGLASARPKIDLPRLSPKLNLLLFFSNPPNPQRFQAWRPSRPRSYFLSGVFIGFLSFVDYYIPNPSLGCPRGVMVKAMDCGIVVSEFELQSRYCVHFRTPRAREHLHSTNPYTKRKVLSLTKPKGKIYKTKSLHNYITILLLIILYFDLTFITLPISHSPKFMTNCLSGWGSLTL